MATHGAAHHETHTNPVPLGYALAVLPLMALAGLVWAYATGRSIPSVPFLPELGLMISFRLDAMGVLFGGLVTGIGALVLGYAGHYMAHEPHPTRFLLTLTAFMASMLGLVLADDLIALFVFWELTSITSFLLIGQTRTEQARRGATQALLVTGLGGVCLLGAAVLTRHVLGTSDLSALWLMRDTLRASELYPLITGLFFAACLSKSAQFPLHFWLPDSMAAPTPASAYLHSATMVKAGVYLLFRLEPTLGGTTLWTVTLCAAGGTTLLLGAYQGLRQQDLKALLANSTLSQLGTLTLLLGIGGEKARAAFVVGLVAHAAYKCSLFLAAGAVDHATGTRDLRRLGALKAAMPLTALFTGISALSLAGIPPTAGFVGKEFLLASGGWSVLLVGGVAGALLLAQAGRLWLGTFAGSKPCEPDAGYHPHDPHPAMLLAIGLPAVVGLALPWCGPWVNGLLAGAAGVAKVDVFPWHGVNAALLVSLAAIGAGVSIYLLRDRVIGVQDRLADRIPAARAGYDLSLRGVDGLAWLGTRLQSGDLYLYLAVMLAGVGGLLWVLGTGWGVPMPTRWPVLFAGGGWEAGVLTVLKAVTLLLVVAASLTSVVLRGDLAAILALGASGVGMALLFALEPAPDVALVMVVVDILTVVILVQALAKIPRLRREQANAREIPSNRKYLHAGIAAVAGAVVALVSLHMLESRGDRVSRVTPYFEAASKPLTGAVDIVGSIVIDFRGFDTLIEICVFSLAGLTVYSLIKYASRIAKDVPEPPNLSPDYAARLPASIQGIGRPMTSPLLRGVAYGLLPLCLLISCFHMMYGHNGPGDGFTAGVIASLGVAFHFTVLGHDRTRRRLRWLKPTGLIGAGLLLVIGAMATSLLLSPTGTFFAPVDYAALAGVAHLLPPGFSFSTSLLFEVAICLTVFGSASHMVDTLGQPNDADLERDRVLAGLPPTPTDSDARSIFSLEEEVPVATAYTEKVQGEEDVIHASRRTGGDS